MIQLFEMCDKKNIWYSAHLGAITRQRCVKNPCNGTLHFEISVANHLELTLKGLNRYIALSKEQSGMRSVGKHVHLG